MADNTKKRKTRSYLITVLSLLVLLGLCLFYENPFAAEDAKEVMTRLGNAFAVPGVLFAGIGLLSYLASLGAYDSLGYTFSNFALHNIFVSKQPKKYKSLYEYKAAKDEKGRTWWRQGLFVGLASLFVSMVLLVVYYIL